MSEERLSGELAAIEAALCSLSPTPSNIQRDRLMFLAGRASASRRTPKLFWPIATAASLLVATTFVILWAAGNGPWPVEPAADVSVASLPPPFELPADTSPPSPWANRRLCQLVLEKGVDAMPDSTVYGASVAPYVPRDDSCRGLLKQYLANPAG